MQVSGVIQAVSLKPSKYPGTQNASYHINNTWYSHFTSSPHAKEEAITFQAEQKGNFWNIVKNTIQPLSSSAQPPKDDITSYFDKRFTHLDQKVNKVIEMLQGTNTEDKHCQPKDNSQQEGPESFHDDEIPF